MNQIRPWLYIGKYRETKNHSLLKAHQINAMLQLAEAVEQPSITALYLAVDDGIPLSAEMLRKGLDFIKEQKEMDKTMLIACGAGISRSASFAIASLKELEAISLLVAYQEVKSYHRETLPHPALWQSLCEYYNEDISFSEVIR